MTEGGLAGRSPSGHRSSIRYAWYVIFVLMLGYAVALIDRQILSLMVGPIRADLALTDTQISTLHGLAFALFYASFGLPLGWVADHWSRRNLLVLGIACWGIASLACAFVQSYGELFAARMAVGMGEAALAPAAYSLIHDYFPPHNRGKAMTLFSAGVSVGAGFAYIAGGSAVAYGTVGARWLSSAGIVFRPWQFVFVAVSLPALLVLALFTTIREPAKAAVAPGNASPKASLADGVKEIWSRRYYFGPPILGLSIGAIIFNGLFAWVPSHFIRTFGFTPTQIGAAFGLILLTFGVAGMWLAGVISDRLAARHGTRGAAAVIFWGQAVGALGAATFGWMGSPVGALAILCITVFAFAASVAVGPVVVQALATARIRGQSIAVYLLVVNVLGLGIGPTLIAACSDYVLRDEKSVGRAVGVVALVVMPIALWLHRTTWKRLRGDQVAP